MCLLHRLHLLAKAMTQAGRALDKYVFLPLKKNVKEFQENGMTSQAMNKRLQVHMMAIKEWRGHTIHSLKRGRLQDDMITRGQTVGQVAMGRHRNEHTTSLYLNPTRHAGRLVPKREDGASGSA